MTPQSPNLLKIERERLVLLDDLHELVFNFKLGGNFFYVNAGWLKKLQYERDEAAQLGFDDILQKDQVQKWHKIQHRLAHGAGYSSLDFIFKTKKGEDLIVQGSLHPMLDEGAGKHSIVGIFKM